MYDLLWKKLYIEVTKVLKGYMLHRSRRPKNPSKSITLVTDVNKRRLRKLKGLLSKAELGL